jgi:malate dehydrogenase
MGNAACFEGVSRQQLQPPKGNYKVCVYAGGGAMGQSIAMLMALDPLVSELSVYDLTISMVPAEGVAADLRHLDSRCRVKAYALDTSQMGKPIAHLEECLTGCSLVLVPLGVPEKPNQDFLGINCGIAKGLVEACAKFCPKAIVGIGISPGESVVPAMARLYEKSGLDPKKIVGITTIHTLRAAKFVHEVTKAPIEAIDVPVVGGFSAECMVPLFSQEKACENLKKSQIDELCRRFQDADQEVLRARKKTRATLSMAYAIAKFGKSVLQGLSGRRNESCAYVKSSALEGSPFFTSKVTFGPGGIEATAPVGPMNENEKQCLDKVCAKLQDEIRKGIDFAEKNELATR